MDVQWTDVLALMGDASDNVPGVKGIGPKGALSLIQRYGTIEGVIEHAAEVIPLHTCALSLLLSASLHSLPEATLVI